MTDSLPERLVIPEDAAPDRADKTLAKLLPGAPARSSVTKLLRSGRVSVRGRTLKASETLNPGDIVMISPPPPDVAPPGRPARVIVPALYEDTDVVIFDKPAGLSVHPGAGRPQPTLMDYLLETRPEVKGVGEEGRWGIVHRLDKDTSGVMAAAKTVAAFTALSAMFKAHSPARVYIAIVRGAPGADMGTIDAGLGRGRADRTRMSIHTDKPRRAVTHWRVLLRIGRISVLEITPDTGRTHQIRAHLASVGLPVLGDPVYGARRNAALKDPSERKPAAGLISRQALHAYSLGFPHPITGEYLELSSHPPDDMKAVLESSGENWNTIEQLILMPRPTG